MAYSFTSEGATPHLPQGSTPTPPNGGTPQARALNGMQQANPSIPLIPPMTTDKPALKSHSIQHPDGTVITQEFHKPEAGLLSPSKPVAPKKEAPEQPKMPEVKMINGEHHVPFKSADGSIKFINARGETH